MTAKQKQGKRKDGTKAPITNENGPYAITRVHRHDVNVVLSHTQVALKGVITNSDSALFRKALQVNFAPSCAPGLRR